MPSQHAEGPHFRPVTAWRAMRKIPILNCLEIECGNHQCQETADRARWRGRAGRAGREGRRGQQGPDSDGCGKTSGPPHCMVTYRDQLEL